MDDTEKVAKPGIFEKMIKKGYIYLANRGWVHFKDYYELLKKLGQNRWGERDE